MHAKTMGAVRLTALEAGRRMVDAGQISDPNHAIFLTAKEIVGWLRAPSDISQLVDIRRGQHAWAKGHSPAPFLGDHSPMPGRRHLPRRGATDHEGLGARDHPRRPTCGVGRRRRRCCSLSRCPHRTGSHRHGARRVPQSPTWRRPCCTDHHIAVGSPLPSYRRTRDRGRGPSVTSGHRCARSTACRQWWDVRMQ